MFCAWGSSDDGVETQEGVPLKTAGGTRGRDTMEGHNQGVEVGRSPGRMAMTHRELLTGVHRGASADAPRAPTRSRQTERWVGGVWLSGQVIWGASKTIWISGQSVWLLRLRQFGFLGFCPMVQMAHSLDAGRGTLCALGGLARTAPWVVPAPSPGPRSLGPLDC